MTLWQIEGYFDVIPTVRRTTRHPRRNFSALRPMALGLIALAGAIPVPAVKARTSKITGAP